MANVALTALLVLIAIIELRAVCWQLGKLIADARQARAAWRRFKVERHADRYVDRHL